MRVLVHQAFFPGDPRPHYFMKVTNLSKNRDISVEHIWFATEPPKHILDPALPARLRPDETFETAIPAELPDGSNIEQLGRVRLSNGKVLKSRLNHNVPPFGMVARGGRS